MRVAVVDVAAESGGALSVLKDFLNYISNLEMDQNEYFVFVSKPIEIKKNNIHYILESEIKKSWFRRLKWERYGANKEFKALKIDVIISLQNTAFYLKNIRQIIYFHNVLLLESKKKYSLWKKDERIYAIYTKFVAPYTLRSLKYADTIICQTQTVKEEIHKKNSEANIVVVNPNVYVDDEYINSAIRPIKGFIYPTAAVPFKCIEETIECVKKNNNWFFENDLELLITIDGSENAYSRAVYELGKNVKCIHFIGYQSRNKVLDLYKNHGLIINSELESFPLPFKEAEIVGSLIVAAGYDYAKEILDGVKSAYLYSPHDINSMFCSMQDAYSNNKIEKTFFEKNNTWSEVVSLL